MDDYKNKAAARPLGLYSALFLYISLLMSTQLLASVEGYLDPIEIYEGHTEILSHKNVNRVSIGNGKIADVKVLANSNQVMVIAKEKGVTDLRIWRKDGSQVKHVLRIVEIPKDEILEKVQAHIADIEGVHARIVGDHVVIEGSGLRDIDVKKVEKVEKLFPKTVQYVTGGGVTMGGMILLDVKVVEIRKTEIKRIGIDWIDLAAGPTFGFLSDIQTNSFFRSTTAPGSAAALPLDVGEKNAFLGLSTNITSILNFLNQNGDARMLAEPKLTCRSGGSAEFLAGGEVPIPITDSNGALNVIFKQYGIILKMSPESDAAGYISTKITVEVSNIDPTVTVLGIPGFLSRKTETDMNVRNGQTMVISGLFSSNASKTVNKVPGFGEVPIIGELFKSRDFQNNETDLVVFVTPSLIDPEHKKNRAMLNKAHELRTQTNDEELRFKLMD